MTRKLTAEQFRDCFPVLSDTVHLAGCSQAPMSPELHAALSEMTFTLREHGAPWEIWMAEAERARTGFAELIGAEADEVAVLSCASEGAYQVASTTDWSRRPAVVTTDMEFPSIAQVWLAQRGRGARVRHVPERAASVDPDELVDAIDERTALVSIPLVSYRNGALLPLRRAAERARAVGARVFVDAYQAAGVQPIDVRELECDYLVAGTLKYLLGLPGLAFLYVRGGLVDDVAPQLTGWFGRVDPFAFDPRNIDHPSQARRFETGTPGIPAVYAANAGLRLLSRVDPHEVRGHVESLVAETTRRLLAAGERVWAPPTPGPQVALLDDNPGELGNFLARRRIVTAPRGDVVRLSFHHYNNMSDVDTVCSAVDDYRRS